MPSLRQAASGFVVHICLLVILSGPLIASPMPGRDEGAEILRVFEQSYPDDLQSLEGQLRARAGPEAKLYLAMFLHWEKPALRMPGGEVASLLAQARNEAIQRQLHWSDRHDQNRERHLGRLTPYDGTTNSLILHLRHSGGGLTFFQVPCRFFLRHPEIGVLARSVSQDRWRHGAIGVACEDYLKARLKNVFEIFAHRHPANTIPCGGTIGRDIRAGQIEAREALLYSPKDVRSHAAEPPAPQMTLRHTSLFDWALLGRWNYQVFQGLEALYLQAVDELVTYLVQVFALPKADAQQAARLGLLVQLRGARYRQPPIQPNPVRAAILEGREVDPDVLRPYEDHPAAPNGGNWGPLSGYPEPLLFLAVDRPDVVKLLLDHGFEPEVRNAFGKTALMAAAQAGNLRSVQLLLAAGASVDARTLPPERVRGNGPEADYLGRCGPYVIRHGRRTALMYAAAEASAQVIEAFLTAGANPCAKDSLGKVAADYLTGDGPTAANAKMSAPERTALARQLRELALAAPPDIDAPVNDLGQTALHLAVMQGSRKQVDQLLRQGVDLEIFDNSGRTALAVAASENRTDLMERLLNAGAGIDARLNEGFGPLEEALFAGAGQAVSLLLDRGQRLQRHSYDSSKTGPRSLYGRLAKPDRLEVARLLLDVGLDYKLKKRLAWSATWAGNKDLLALLQAYGIGLNGVALGRDSSSYAEVAVRADQPHSLQALQDLGVDLKALDSDEQPLVVLALRERKLKALQKLLDLGFDPFVGTRPNAMALFIGVAIARPTLVDSALAAGARTDDRLDDLSYRDTVTHLALDTRRLDSLALLASHGADFNALSRSGNTPLTMAASMNLGSDWIAALIGGGADPCRPDRFGRPPLHSAVMQGAVGAVRGLLEAGVSPASRDSRGHDALDYARERRHRPILGTLETHSGGDLCLEGAN